MSSLYLPGLGMVNLAARRLHQAVSEYDERLLFTQNPDTGQWTVFYKIDRDAPDDFGTMIAGERVYPVLAFDRDPEQLAPHAVIDRLQKADAVRRGEKVLDEIHDANYRAGQAARDAADTGTGLLVEALESYKRNKGETSYLTSYRPRKSFQSGRRS